MSSASIILIGPYLAGKSTLRRLLAEALGLPQCSLNPFEDDELTMHYWREAGYDESADASIRATQGRAGQYHYWQSFAPYAVERCLADHPGHLIEIGAVLSVYSDARLFARVQTALAPHPHVILVLPSPDRDESYRVLRERYRALFPPDEMARFVRHPCNRALAKHIVYTHGKTAEETGDEVLRLVAPGGTARTPITLIGPPTAGKSTIANLLASRLRLPQVALDVVGWDLACAAGYNETVAQRIREQMGDADADHYTESIWATVIERVIAEHPNEIIDFGAGHSVYEVPKTFSRVQAALAPHPSVILLLPSPDPDESLQILLDRPRTTIEGVDANKYLLDHPSNYALAKLVVYTGGKSPEETRDEILRRI